MLVRRGREHEYKILRCEQGNCLLGRFYSLKRAHRPPSPRPLHPSAPLSLSLPQRVCSSIGQLFFPSTSLCVSCFVLVLFSRIPEFIEGFIGLSRASLSFLNHYSPLTFAASSLGDSGGGLLLVPERITSMC